MVVPGTIRWVWPVALLALLAALMSVVSPAQAAPGDGEAITWGSDQFGQLGLNMPAAVDASGVLAGKTVTAVSAGSSHACAVADGAVYCWGNNNGGQLGDGTTSNSPVPVAVDKSGVLAGLTVTDVTVGGSHSCAVADHAAYCWGRNQFGQLGDNSTTQRLTPVAVNTSGVLAGATVTTVSAGAFSTCGVADGGAYCWGNNSGGRLGNNSETLSLVPVAVYTAGVLAGTTVTDISVGGSHACTVADGAAFCWGQNINGRLGNNSTTKSLVPVAVNTSGVLAGTTVTGISAGDTFSCAVADGAAACWGRNAYGQLGDNSTTQRLTPVAVNTSGVLAGATVTSISAGEIHTCALADGAAYCWGNNNYGQLGDNSTSQSLVPVAVNTSGALAGATATDVSSGSGFTCIVAEGQAFCAGDNNSSKLGLELPVGVDASSALSGTDVTHISAGNYHTCAVADGAAYCWGQNSNGQLGNNTTTTSPIPVAVSAAGALAGKTVTSISAGSSHTCALADGEAFCWGSNGNGQLGNNTTTASLVPVAVNTAGTLAGKLVTDISAGVNFTCAVADSTASCWGQNNTGQLGDNSTTQSLVPVAVDTAGILAGATITNISAGLGHSCAVADSTASCWGSNISGQLGDNSTTQSPVPVAVDTSGVLAGATITDIGAGAGHSCAVADGTASCWGVNTYGQLGDNSTTQSLVPIAVDTSGVLAGTTVTDVGVGQSHTCAVADGGGACWGQNLSGQLGDNSLTQRLVPVAVNTTGVLAGKALTRISAFGSQSAAIAADPFTVTFDPNGGSGSMADQVSAVPAALNANIFTRSGYTFINWNTAADGSGTAYDDGALYPFASSAKLYAQWQAIAPAPDPSTTPTPTPSTSPSTSPTPTPTTSPQPDPSPTPTSTPRPTTELTIKRVAEPADVTPSKRVRLVKAVVNQPQVDQEKAGTAFKRVKTVCLLKGETLRGKEKRQNCGYTKAVTSRSVVIRAKPTCSVGLKLRTKIVARQPGHTRATWKRTWKVSNDPRTYCGLTGNG